MCAKTQLNIWDEALCENSLQLKLIYYFRKRFYYRHWRRSGFLMLYFAPCSSVSIVNFEHVIAGWQITPDIFLSWWETEATMYNKHDLQVILQVWS